MLSENNTCTDYIVHPESGLEYPPGPDSPTFRAAKDK